MAAVLLATMPLAADVDEFSRSVAVIEAEGSRGTGFLVGERLVMTAAHVAGSGRVTVNFPDMTTAGDVVAIDAANDLALVELESAPSMRPLALATAPPRLGEEVLAIGAPTSGLTVTRGIVSAILLGGEIQTDASVNPGNSGGPLLRPEGDVLGVVTMKAAAEGIGYASGAGPMRALLTQERVESPSGGPVVQSTDGATQPVDPDPTPVESSISMAVPLGAAGALLLSATTILALRARATRRATPKDDFEVRLGPTHERTGG